MPGIASLPMYDFPEIRESTQMLWQKIRQELAKKGINSPKELAQPTDFLKFWRDPNLMFSQTCGLPFVRHLREDVKILGTPDYGLGTRPGWYHSVFIVRHNDPRQDLSEMRGSCFCFNSKGSQSGLYAPMHSLYSTFGTSDFFKEMKISGGHALSAIMVAKNQADIAAIDAVTWRLLEQFHPVTRSLRMLEITKETPGLPYICHKSQNGDLVAECVKNGIENLPKAHKDALGITGFWRSKPDDYTIISENAIQVSGALKKFGLGE